MSTGIAMIARNGARTLPLALGPFLALVDDIVIVLGGTSDDDTPAVAAEYGRVMDYAGPLDDSGRLLDFSAARQQATDALSTDWMMVIDCDDIWTGAEHLRQIVTAAETNQVDFVSFPYRLKSQQLDQPRLYRRDSGRWVQPVHEFWRLHNVPGRAARVSQMTVSQKGGNQRGDHNIRIAEHWLKTNEPTSALLAMLTRDYVLAGRLDDAERTAILYLAISNGSSGEFFVLFYLAYVYLTTGRYEQAVNSALVATGQKSGYGPAWAVAADAALNLGRPEQAIVYADKALMVGAVDCGNYPHDPAHISSTPMRIKAKALEQLGRVSEAKAALNLAAMMED